MAIEVPDLLTLSDAEVQQTLDYIAQRVGEYEPSVNTNRGVVREIVLRLNAVLGAAAAQVITDEVGNASSLLKITEDPAGADPDMRAGQIGDMDVIADAGPAGRAARPGAR